MKADQRFSNSFLINETPFLPSVNRKLIRSSDDMGWSDIAGLIVEIDSPDENVLLPNAAIHISLTLNSTTCEIEGDHFSGRLAVEAGYTTIIAPQSRVEIRVEKPSKSCNVCIRPSVFTEVSEDIYGKKFDYADIIADYKQSDEGLSYLVQALRSLLFDEQNDRFRNEYISRAIAAQVLAKFARANGVQKSRDVLPALSNRQLRIIDDFLAANLHGRFNLNDLAASVGLGRTVFFQRFSHTVRQTPNQYLQKLRVENAHHLLKKPDLTLAEIAQICGFSDQSHMSRFFVRHFGMAPGKYRRTVG